MTHPSANQSAAPSVSPRRRMAGRLLSMLCALVLGLGLVAAGGLTQTASAATGWVTTCSSPDYGYSCVASSGYQGQSTWGYPVDSRGHNCTNYVAYRLNRNGASNPGNLGNANNWDNAAAQKGFLVDGNPVVGAVAQWEGNTGPATGVAEGHVAYVEAVTGTYIDISQDSWGGTTSTARIQRGGTYWPSHFIHIKDVPTGNPQGALDLASSPAPGQLRVGGWALDTDAKTTPIAVHIYVGGPAGASGAQGFNLGLANGSRPDVGAAFPGVGNNHGFDRTLNVARFGSQPVYAYAINAGGTPGDNVLIGSKTVNIPNPNPFGALDSVKVVEPGRVSVSGWSADPSAPTTPIDVHVYSGSTFLGKVRADGSRPDVAAAYPGYGKQHGYAATFNAPGGNLTICSYGINYGIGTANTQIGCKAVTVPSGDPFGALDSVSSPEPGLVVVRGWSADPSAKTTPTSVHFYAGDVLVGAVSANKTRTDVGAANPGYGDAHGYDTSLRVSAGQQRVCAYAINIAGGMNNVQLGCKDVVVAADTTAPRAWLTKPGKATTHRESVKVGWQGDDWGTGIVKYQVRMKHKAAGRSWSRWVTPSAWSDLTGHAKLYPGMRPHTTYCFAVSAIDYAGNRSTWSPRTCIKRV